jgi:hypothetical protein
VNTASYGSPEAGALLGKYPWLGRLATWSTLVFELGFVLVFVVPPPLVVVPLALGVMFHAGIAAVMGLNNFVWAFTSTYPAVLFVSLEIRSLMVP